MRVLHIEDHAGDAALVAEAIRETGVDLDLTCVVNGLRAIEYLHQTTDETRPIPDFILLDLVMPGLDGMSFLRMWLKHPTWRSIPVVVLTSSSSDEHRQQVEALGVTYLVKPQSFEEYGRLALSLSRFPDVT